MLILHAAAALYGRDGATRNDARAIRLVDRMTRAPMFLLPSPTPVHGRTVCWGRRLTTSVRDHVSLDSQVAEALAVAWKARGALDMPHVLRGPLRSAVERCARHPAWRFPNALVNQFNSNAQLYAAAARVTGHYDQMRRDYRAFLGRFTTGITRPEPGRVTANLGPGFGFHYQPHRPAWVKLNFDTPEYANIVLSGFQYYTAARKAGMAALSPRATALTRAWVVRLLAGAWTHAGYLNWDTGYGRHRWQSGQYWAFAQQGLLAIASNDVLSAAPRRARWAKAMFDRGLELYDRWGRETGTGIAPQNPFDVRSEHRDHDLYASRIAANAVRAVMLGLGHAASADPPPLYAFDCESGRLAVTTPRYSTAIVPTSRGACAYGGTEIARLFGPGHRVAGNIGGKPPDSFGVIVRDADGRRVLTTQHQRTGLGHLRVLASPTRPDRACPPVRDPAVRRPVHAPRRARSHGRRRSAGHEPLWVPSRRDRGQLDGPLRRVRRPEHRCALPELDGRRDPSAADGGRGHPT